MVVKDGDMNFHGIPKNPLKNITNQNTSKFSEEMIFSLKPWTAYLEDGAKPLRKYVTAVTLPPIVMVQWKMDENGSLQC